MNRTIRSISTALVAATLIALGSSPAAASGNVGAPPVDDTVVVDPGGVAESTQVDPGGAPVSTGVDAGAAAAVANDKGISVAEAERLLAQQQAFGDKGVKLEKSLKGRSAGSYLDADGNLVVTSLDATSDAVVAKGGARAQRVDDSGARLDHIMQQLNKQAERNGAGGLQGWYVDIPTNTVVVTVTVGADDPKTKAMTKLAATFGASLRIEYASAQVAPTTTAEYLTGGSQIVIPGGGTCSIGFNTVDAANRPVVLTAGHCVEVGSSISRNGYLIGSGRTKYFPGDDFGTFWNSYPSYWVPTASVNMYNGRYMNVRGSWTNPPVGATVCKSGRTTGWTCGTITALNSSVVYKGGRYMSGLVQHNACVEGGDSGGANMSSGGYALGVTSGASTNITTGKCLSKQGQPNVSWYQPIGEALNANGLRLLVTG
jgi:hypothetical protein